MSNRKSKGKRITEFQNYESSKENGGYENKYTRITHIQLICMNELSNSAFRLYIMMKDYAVGNINFTFPHRIYQNFISNQGFINARDELIKYGYIENFISYKNMRKENQYKFSAFWRERNRDYIKEVIDKEKNKIKTLMPDSVHYRW
jgi:hypothetical protein